MRKVLAGTLGVLTAVLCVACGASGDPVGMPEVDDSRTDEIEGALLPDIVVRESDLYDHVVEPGPGPGQATLRLSNGTANVGEGKLHLWGVLPANADNTQTVMQRIFKADGTFADQEAGKFLYHSGHSHVHFDGWGAYRVREILPGDGVGQVLAEGTKTSFCIIDIGVYDSSLPNFNPAGEFKGCGAIIQGLSVGWIDVYSKYLSGQSIDVSNVPPGEYWLESEVDPDDHVEESNETNNATRIKITLGSLPAQPDAYEPNETREAVDARPPGGPKSPNLGPSNPERVVPSLSVHSATDVDWFRFVANETGAAGDEVRVTAPSDLLLLDVTLHDSTGGLVATASDSGDGALVVSLEGRPEGAYYARVSGKVGATVASYELTVDPPANAPPSITLTAPAAGNVDVIHGYDNYEATWTASDPEADETWVTIWVNDAPTLDGTQILIPTSLNTPSGYGKSLVNSAYVTLGTYWVYAEITDGGTTVGAWSPGTVTFEPSPVCEHSMCAAGSKLTAVSCDPCVAQICAVDPYCCNTGWDSICVGEVQSVCNQSCVACGDAECHASESCQTCPSDCGACPTCGDSTCHASESCATCPADCGACPVCGDATCSGTETCDTCPSDCGVCQCAHDECIEGVELFASCDACVGQICAVDSYCCTTAWDSICVGEVQSVCMSSCP